MAIKPPVLLAALMIGGSTLAPSAAAINSSPSSEAARRTAQVNVLESKDLVAGRGIISDIFGRRSRSRFERFYYRRCEGRYTLRECYSLYNNKLGRRRRFRRRRRRRFERLNDRFDRFDDRFDRRRRRGDDDD